MTTSEEGKKLKNVEPHWQPDGLLNIASERYAKRKETLADVLLLAERLSADNPSDAAAVERLIELVEHGRRLAVSLLTACKATQTQQAKNSRVPAERTDLLHATERLEALAERARNWGRVFPKDLEGRPAGEWLEFEEAAQSRVILRPTEADRRIEEPLGALYTHLKSSMKIMVQMPDGTHPTVMSCSSAESYLKNSTDTATRRQVFGAYNAWFAENAAPFAALLNAMTGHRLNLSDRAGMSMLDASLKSERMSRPAFDAMMRAVRAAAPRARNAVQLSGMVLSCLEGRRSGLSVANLFAPLPEAAPLEAAASFDGAADALRRTFSRIDPDFQGFLKRLLSAGWIETSNISGGEGGTWCAQVPACSAVAVYADYQPTLNRACELAHILGEASLRDRLIAYPAIAQNPSLLSCEIAGRFFMDAFLAQLLEETEWERREHAAVLWQALRQIGVNLLHLPFRFELSHRLHEERRHGYLSVQAHQHHLGGLFRGHGPRVRPVRLGRQASFLSAARAPLRLAVHGGLPHRGRSEAQASGRRLHGLRRLVRGLPLRLRDDRLRRAHQTPPRRRSRLRRLLDGRCHGGAQRHARCRPPHPVLHLLRREGPEKNKKAKDKKESPVRRTARGFSDFRSRPQGGAPEGERAFVRRGSRARRSCRA